MIMFMMVTVVMMMMMMMMMIGVVYSKECSGGVPSWHCLLYLLAP